MTTNSGYRHTKTLNVERTNKLVNLHIFPKFPQDFKTFSVYECETNSYYKTCE